MINFCLRRKEINEVFTIRTSGKKISQKLSHCNISPSIAVKAYKDIEALIFSNRHSSRADWLWRIARVTRTFFRTSCAHVAANPHRQFNQLYATPHCRTVNQSHYFFIFSEWIYIVYYSPIRSIYLWQYCLCKWRVHNSCALYFFCFQGKVHFSNMRGTQCVIKTILLIFAAFCRILHVTVAHCSCEYMNLILDFPRSFLSFVSFIHSIQNPFILEIRFVLNFIVRIKSDSYYYYCHKLRLIFINMTYKFCNKFLLSVDQIVAIFVFGNNSVEQMRESSFTRI